MASPTVQSRKLLESTGYLVGKTEYYNPRARKSRDLFGFVDMIACKPGEILFVQVTSGSHHSTRRKKICTPPVSKDAKTVLESGGKIVVLSWSLRGPRGSRKKLTPRFEDITTDMLSF